MGRGHGRGRGRAQDGDSGRYRGHHEATRKVTKNMFVNLADQDSFGMTEMNAHLPERFGNGQMDVGAGLSRYNEESSQRQQQHNSNETQDIQKYFEIAEKPVACGSWLSKPEIPSSKEILANNIIHGTPSPNKVEGPYDSNEEYLATQYKLLREDAIRPLREAVAQIAAEPFKKEVDYAGGTVGLYEPVYFTTITFSPRGIALRAAFSLGRIEKRVRWDQSKRLITGSLVALSPADDAFKHICVLAIVAARPKSALEQNPPEIDLFFAADDIDIDPTKKWIMVENRASFFEAGRHTLSALQHMMREPFPLSDHLVKADKAIEAPIYLLENPFKDLSSIVALEEGSKFENVNVLEGLPKDLSTGLDRSQTAALQRMLTKRLAVVQGPPGTGKTYVSVVALKVLLTNRRDGDPPIIVTSQTNHALDQTLRHIAPFEPQFVRLGGRSKDRDVVKCRTVFQLRAGMPEGKPRATLTARAFGEMRKLTSEMRTLLVPLEVNKPPLDHNLLKDLGIITQEQAESMETGCAETLGIAPDTPGIQTEVWLGNLKIESLRPIQPDSFGFELEDGDLDFEELKELEAEAVAQDDDDIEALKGEYTILSDNYTAKTPTSKSDNQIRELLRTQSNLYSIKPKDRGAVYQYFQRQTKKLITEEIRKKAKRYEKLVQMRRIGLWEQDYSTILKDQHVIGMTTTGLSKYRALISALKPKIILVEEAAETLEPPVAVACIPSLEHLILVGDHKQLRPHCQIREHENGPYHFNLSLFERMVNNGIEFDTLTRQRRMIPEIRRLLKPIYGEELKDHQSVKEVGNRPPVEGMGGCNSFFFTHEWPESQDLNKSYFNQKEASMIVGFFDYLVFNGVDPPKITVLTFYNGQRKVIVKGLRSHPNLRGFSFNVTTVDSYQGEENDIVLLSLVRSNPKYQIGFLNVDNRVCVALSRARRGFYVFGNGEILASESKTWAYVVEFMYGKKGGKPATGPKHRLGYKLPLTCSNHNYKTFVQDPSDWEYINGGCDMDCRCPLPCGHNCMLRCHPFEGSRIQCTQRCDRPLECGHPCSNLCCDPCRCARCEDRNPSGKRALLKPITLNRITSQQSVVQAQTPYVPKPATRRLQGWKDYANGGSEERHAELARKAGEIDTKFFDASSKGSGGLSSNADRRSDSSPRSMTAALVKVSSLQSESSPPASDVVIDFGQPAPLRRFRFKETVTVVPAASIDTTPPKVSRGPQLSLLD
ncbi:P-loop containing nucleoside triphosphate hydrolase protein [Delitschia confertaspora ATCC 74209]|uniref:P-loop containing nucleoside triphosphate hydrolase protein n=1 Tax=Delitschia confertaspora ATCC 74209 TaxID=1513339 RepID=A0A9P4MXU5_9PLEO|nr:P-loop containing nucleoside triphosphate hydrolase protein [Delitschia confertaspora ATCC 74209]